MITAAHCADIANQDLDGDGNIETFISHTYQDNKGTFHNIATVANPAYGGGVNGDDSAVATFATSQGFNGLPICDNQPAAGDAFTIVGFGCNEYNPTGTGCTGSGVGSKRSGTNTITAIGVTITFTGVSDDPTSDGTNSASGSGDSGGPMIVTQGGVNCIAGVTSGGSVTDSDGDGNNDTKNSTYVNLHNASSVTFISNQFAGMDCDIYENNCLSRVTDIVNGIWKSTRLRNKHPANTANYVNRLTTAQIMLDTVKSEEKTRYRKVIVPILSIILNRSN